jgi:eukaryotic-like serine/threonine-protein kinase
MSELTDTLTSAGVREDPLFGTPYRTIAVLGRGGMGEVIEAEHLPLGRRVVVKLVHEHLAEDPRFYDRLRIEARSLSLITHPNVVAVSDFGCTPARRPYVVMERLHGRTLGQELRARGALPPGEAIAIVRQVLAGLGAAHAHGIIHRDVKADNIVLCEDGLVKLLDFGVVKILHEDGAPRALAPAYPTKEGVLVGSPRFVAPEQVRGAAVDARTDIYGAGLLLYTLVAGRSPFAHINDMVALLTAHLRDAPPPPSQVAPQPLPVELERAILKALAKAPEHRFQSAEAFAQELEELARRADAPASQRALQATVVMPITLPAPAEPAASMIPFHRDPRARMFAVVTLGSAVVASLLISLAFRLLGAP